MAFPAPEKDPSLDPAGRDAGWWEYRRGAATVWVPARRREEARRRAEAQLRDLGALPGGPPGLRESLTALRAFAARRERR